MRLVFFSKVPVPIGTALLVLAVYLSMALCVKQMSAQQWRPDNAEIAIKLKKPYGQEGTSAYYAPLKELASIADGPDHPERSPLVVFENRLPLNSAHALHEDVRMLGHGRYSHWNNSLIFSTSDNSNPNLNGRVYWAVVPLKTQ